MSHRLFFITIFLVAACGDKDDGTGDSSTTTNPSETDSPGSTHTDTEPPPEETAHTGETTTPITTPPTTDTTTTTTAIVSPADDISAGELVITEIMQNPDAVTDQEGEWFELHNSAGRTLDLEGLVVSKLDGSSFEVMGSMEVIAGGYVVFAVNSVTMNNGGVSVDYEYDYGDLSLGNSADALLVSNASGVLDQVMYDGGIVFPDSAGRAMMLKPAYTNATDNDNGSSWCDASSPYGQGDYGTPGSANPVCEVITNPTGHTGLGGTGAETAVNPTGGTGVIVWPTGDTSLPTGSTGVNPTGGTGVIIWPTGGTGLPTGGTGMITGGTGMATGGTGMATGGTGMATGGTGVIIWPTGDTAPPTGGTGMVTGGTGTTGVIIWPTGDTAPPTGGTGMATGGTGVIIWPTGDTAPPTGGTGMVTGGTGTTGVIIWPTGDTAPPTGGTGMVTGGTGMVTGGTGVMPTGGTGVMPTGGTGVVATGGTGIMPTGGTGVMPTGGTGVVATGDTNLVHTGLAAQSPVAGDLVITEIMRNPAATLDPNGEWFEVYNPTLYAIDLAGLIIRDNDYDSYTVSGGVVQPGEYYVIMKNDDLTVNGGVYADLVATFILANGADELVLEYGGFVVDEVLWDATFPDPAGASIILDPDYTNSTSNNDPAYWCVSTIALGIDVDYGSPGYVNEQCP